MNRFYFTVFYYFLLGTPLLLAQTTAGFEDLAVPVDSFFNGSDAAGGFASGAIFLPNDYNPAFDSWTGWAVSTVTDTTTRGPANQYSAITGSGYAGSSTYAVSFGSAFSPTTIELTGDARSGVVSELYITNNTYTYYSMLEGDMFSKRFGGETGDDPDFLRLTFKKYLDGALGADSLDFYLADYRFTDNSQDYIIDEWTRLDLSVLGNADSIQVTMSGTDVGQFGLNTPSYFCIDAVTTLDGTVAVAEPTVRPRLRIFPNPAGERIQIRGVESTRIRSIALYDLQGRLVRRFPHVTNLDLTGINKGIYTLQIIEDQRFFAQKLIKN